MGLERKVSGEGAKIQVAIQFRIQERGVGGMVDIHDSHLRGIRA